MFYLLINLLNYLFIYRGGGGGLNMFYCVEMFTLGSDIKLSGLHSGSQSNSISVSTQKSYLFKPESL